MLKWLKGSVKISSGVDITIIHHIKSCSEMITRRREDGGWRSSGFEVRSPKLVRHFYRQKVFVQGDILRPF